MISRITFFLLFPAIICVTSCGSGNGTGTSDSLSTDSSVELKSDKQDSADKANEIRIEQPFHLSPEDSTRVADSVERTKNHVRDFE